MSRLTEQRALVALRAREVARARLETTAARHWLVHAVRRRIGSPAGLATAFAAGFLWGSTQMRGARQPEPADPNRRPLLKRAQQLLVAASWVLRQLGPLGVPRVP